MSSTLTTTDPKTGETRETTIVESSHADVDTICRAAREAAFAPQLHDRRWRSRLLRALSASLESAQSDLLNTALAETGLTRERLTNELARTCFQLELFAEAIDDGEPLEAIIDHAGETAIGFQPDVRRMLIPIGPVAVFGSSNFPFAFSVPGGDTASALAAGNPVVVKAHSAHPLTSRVAFDALSEGARSCDAPTGMIGIVYGQSAGLALVSHPDIAAVGFTGSLAAAGRLQAAINDRATPIPFYGELQSVNPLIVTRAALQARGPQIAAGLAASVTASGGQLCTKPGIAFIPEGTEADSFATTVATRIRSADAGYLLNERVMTGFERGARKLEQAPGVRTLLGDADECSPGSGYASRPRVMRVHASDLTTDHTEEVFGPLVLLVDFADDAQLRQALSEVPCSLTTTLHIEPSDEGWARDLLPLIQASSGRLIVNGFPTGVRVAWAQNHGGPWPATNSIHTSVGVTAMRRFQRPFTWQDSPASLLPPELHDSYHQIGRRIDGTRVPGSARA